jgi:hypothetical protein
VTTRSILHQIACKGYAVSLRRVDGKVHAEAILLSDPSQRHISRSYDGEDEEETRRAVAALAKMVGVTLAEDWRFFFEIC